MKQFNNERYSNTIMLGLSNAEYINCVFDQIIIANDKITNCRFINCEFSETYFGETIIKKNIFENCKMHFCSFAFSSFVENIIINTTFFFSNLYKSKLNNNIIKNSDFLNNNLGHIRIDAKNQFIDTTFDSGQPQVQTSFFVDFVNSFCESNKTPIQAPELNSNNFNIKNKQVSNRDFSKKIFSKNFLSNKTFTNCKFNSAVFSFNNIENTEFLDCDLSCTCFAFASFENCKFINSKMKEANAYKTSFNKCSISKSDLKLSNYSFAIFNLCVFNHVEQKEALLLKTTFKNNNITKTNFIDVACFDINVEENNYIDNKSLYNYDKKNFKKITYSGMRESDALKVPYGKVISVFGSGLKGNISLNKEYQKRYNHNKEENFNLIDNFISSKMSEIIKNEKNAKFICYAKQRVPNFDKDVQNHIVCQNAPELLNMLDDKFLLHKWAKDIVNCLHYEYELGQNINVQNCQKLLKTDNDTFVIQYHKSCGGEQTFLLNKDNEASVSKRLIPNEKYSISLYYKNISTNVHFLIADENEIIFPPSIQIIDTSKNMMEYLGCDFVVYDSLITKELHEKTMMETKIIVDELRKLGYRGIGGIDYIVTKDNVYFIEINPRYQSSTNVLNLALSQNSLPTINELDYMCFTEKKLPKLRSFKVQYSKQSINDGESKEFIKNKKIYIRDGYNETELVDNDVYLYTVIYKQSLWKVLNSSKKKIIS